jgi:GTP-binding protein
VAPAVAGLPVVAIAGRPNVGKSTLFNRLSGRRTAIVDDTPGVTRDRKEAPAELGGRQVILVDTAGLEEAPPDSIAGRMRQSSEAAVAQAALILFVIDARAGVTPADAHFAQWLRKQNKPVLLLANKAEGRAGEGGLYEAYSLGLGEPLPVSAEHGEGFSDLHDAIEALLPEAEEVEGAVKPLQLAIIGRPNAGKSTLLNRLVGQARMITGPEAGLTRDAVGVDFYDGDRPVRLVDTPGLRRKARIEERLEKLSVSASIEALKMAEVVVLVLDATLGLDAQDLTIARLVEREGRALVIALNKWDAAPDREAARRAVADRLTASLAQMKGVSVVPISALTGAGVEKLMPAVWKTHERWNARVPTGALNRWFETMLERHQPPLVEGRRLKLRYITQAKARPPTFILFGTRAETTPEDYRRYLVNGLREDFDLQGTPIRLHCRGSGENPYAED